MIPGKKIQQTNQPKKTQTTKTQRNKPTQTSDFCETTMKKKIQTQGWLSGQLIMKDINFWLLIPHMKGSFPCKIPM